MKWMLALVTMVAGFVIVFAAWYLLRSCGASGPAHVIAIVGGFMIPPVTAMVWAQRDWEES